MRRDHAKPATPSKKILHPSDRRGFINTALILIPSAIASGLEELGKHGSTALVS